MATVSGYKMSYIGILTFGHAAQHDGGAPSLRTLVSKTVVYIILSTQAVTSTVCCASLCLEVNCGAGRSAFY